MVHGSMGDRCVLIANNCTPWHDSMEYQCCLAQAKQNKRKQVRRRFKKVIMSYRKKLAAHVRWRGAYDDNDDNKACSSLLLESVS
jgi:hypothetical protein